MANKINQDVVLLKVSASFLASSVSVLEGFIEPDELSNIERYSDPTILTCYEEVDKVSEKTYTHYGNRYSKETLGVVTVSSDKRSVTVTALVSNDREQAMKEASVYIDLVEDKIKKLIEEAKQELLEALHDMHTIQKKLKIETHCTNDSVFK